MFYAIIMSQSPSVVSNDPQRELLNSSAILPNTDSLEIRPSPGKGRGVFAKRPFKEGELIERAPVIPIPGYEEPDKGTVLFDYAYGWGTDLKDSALVLGFGSLYNHSYTPNGYYVRREEEFCIDFIAIKEILPGEEIMVNYGGSPDAQDPLWFQ